MRASPTSGNSTRHVNCCHSTANTLYVSTFMSTSRKSLQSSRYVPEILSTAQTGDASNSSHALHYANGHDPDFGSAITYDKGGALLRMLRFVLGKDAFRTGLQTYMHAYAFKNTNHYDLFNEMTKVLHLRFLFFADNLQLYLQAAQQHSILDWCGQPLNVTDFMNPWLMQRGFPVVFIESQPAETFMSQVLCC